MGLVMSEEQNVFVRLADFQIQVLRLKEGEMRFFISISHLSLYFIIS